MQSELPDDMVLLILEELASSSSSQAAKLTLMSRSIRPWIEKILYRDIVLDTVRSLKLLGRTLSSLSKEPSFYADTTQTLTIAARSSEVGAFETLLRTCNQVTSIAIWHYDFRLFQPLISAIRKGHLPRLKELSAGFALLVHSFPFSLAFGITHLDAPIRQSEILSGFFRYIPKTVTHLSLTPDYDYVLTDLINELISTLPPTVVVCILHLVPHRLDSIIESLENFTIAEPRIVFMSNEVPEEMTLNETVIEYLYFSYDSFVGNWSRQYPQSQNMWFIAENVVVKRKALREDAK